MTYYLTCTNCRKSHRFQILPKFFYKCEGKPIPFKQNLINYQISLKKPSIFEVAQSQKNNLKIIGKKVDNDLEVDLVD